MRAAPGGPRPRARDAGRPHNYHQFQPLLYQVATSQIAPSDVAFQMRKLFREHPNVDVKLADVATVDAAARTVTMAEGDALSGDAVVVATGAIPNFFRTPGADRHAFPLYSLDDATRLRSRILGVFEAADRDPELLDRGALNFVVVGGGPTGVETAGALGGHDPRHDDRRVPRPRGSAARVHLVDLGHVLLGPVLRDGPRLRGQGAAAQGRAAAPRGQGDGDRGRARHLLGRDDDRDPLRRVGRRHRVGADRPRAGRRRPGRRAGRPHRGRPPERVRDRRRRQHPRPGRPAPARSSGSVAQQSGQWAADNVLADLAGKPRKPFHYRDKGIMAMIGRGAAIAEVGAHRHELHGAIAHAAWLGVHATLMTGVRNRVEGFLDWGWDAFSSTRGPMVLDRSDAARIDWEEDRISESAVA